jgi:hypothetical protein
MTKDDQGIEKMECRGCDNEHVDRRNIGQVVVQKATPGLGWYFGPPRHESADRGLADLDAELEQFAVDAACNPVWSKNWDGVESGDLSACLVALRGDLWLRF